eukprot:UN27727
MRGSELYNGRVVYRKNGINGGWTCAWLKHKKKWVVDDEGLRDKNHFIACCADRETGGANIKIVMSPINLKKNWEVWDSDRLIPDKNIRVESPKVFQKRIIKQAPPILVVCGRVGQYVDMNGSYKRQRSLEDDKVFYKNQNGYVLRWQRFVSTKGDSGQWVFQSPNNKKNNRP